MPKLWCVNSKTGEVFQYTSAEGITDFPRGDFLAYGDYLTTGIESLEFALAWHRISSICDHCRRMVMGPPGSPCTSCDRPTDPAPDLKDEKLQKRSAAMTLDEVKQALGGRYDWLFEKKEYDAVFGIT